MRQTEENVKESAAVAPENELKINEESPEESAPDTAALTEAAPEESMAAAAKKKKRRRIHEVTAENDMKYRGPLSYRHFKIMGWLALVLSQVLVIMKLASRLDPGYAAAAATPMNILGVLSGLALPLLLFSNYALILNARDGYKKMLLRYSAIVAGLFLVFWVAYERYLKGITRILAGDGILPESILGEFTGGWAGYFAFNIFVDLLLCTLFMFFLNYEPKKIFTGRKLIYFRLMAILPLVYEVFSILLKIWAAQGKILLPAWVYPLLTTKPPLAFVMFTVIGLVLKKRERRYMKKGGSREAHQAFLDSNTNSWHFSLYTSLIIFITGILDIIMYVLMSVVLVDFSRLEHATEAEVEALLASSAFIVEHLGFGESAGLLLIIPLLLLFSYTRTHKNTQIDALIPFGGMVLIFVVYLEGVYQLLQMAIPAVP